MDTEAEAGSISLLHEQMPRPITRKDPVLLRHNFWRLAGKCVMVSVSIMDCFLDMLMWHCHCQQGMARAPASTAAYRGQLWPPAIRNCM